MENFIFPVVMTLDGFYQTFQNSDCYVYFKFKYNLKSQICFTLYNFACKFIFDNSGLEFS